ncbi:hypothetical protein BDY19DRAFT_901830 [Irpex rosettiformis]|uniref:Uncharacterized protein n=1 Tax=Irpex rosettiformis TaxID=378272 RepID=A0ACB8UJZ0_9APHY|nr:hypothetical protein BDY19DRAFT_901830 [Irpex rosettiformis]
MATSTPSTSKRNSLHRLSNIFQLASPPFSKTSFDSPRNRLIRTKLPPVHVQYSQTTSISSSVTHDSRDYESTLAPTASIVSDSTLSTSLVPLLGSGRAKSPDPILPVPPTTNELAAEEKMKLIKKSRKISRVLGEVPIPSAMDEYQEIYNTKRLSDVPEDPSSSNSRPTSPSLNMQAVSASAKKVFRRSLTSFGGGVSLQTAEVHRSKSTSALRPSLQLPNILFGEEDARPYSPILFATNDSLELDEGAGTLGDDLQPSCASDDSSIEAKEDRGLVLFSPLRSARDNSLLSSTQQGEETRERVQRQRMERLARILGDGVPPDVLRRAASPSAESSSPSQLYQAADGPRGTVSVEHLPQRASSLRAKITSRRKRPKSLDFTNIRNSGIMSAPITPMESSPAPAPAGIRRASSVQAKATRNTSAAGDDALSQFSETDGPSSEKQRILNVKRAKKLTQVMFTLDVNRTALTIRQLFGDNPPTALFQITNFGAATDSGDLFSTVDSDGHPAQRNSLATIISISSLYSGEDGQRLRDSFISVVTSNSDISAAILTSGSEAHHSKLSQVGGMTVESESEEVEPAEARFKFKSIDIPAVEAPVPIHARPRRSSFSPSLHLAHSPSFELQTRSKLTVPPLAYQPHTPPTPPPFSNFMLSSVPMEYFTQTKSDSLVDPPSRISEPISDDFQARRRRVTKLSKFFGVEVNTLVDHLPNEPSPPLPSRTGFFHTAQNQQLSFYPSSSAQRHPSGAPSVTVAQTRGRYIYQDDVEELDMSEVIEKLRKMKSS